MTSQKTDAICPVSFRIAQIGLSQWPKIFVSMVIKDTFHWETRKRLVVKWVPSYPPMRYYSDFKISWGTRSYLLGFPFHYPKDTKASAGVPHDSNLTHVVVPLGAAICVRTVQLSACGLVIGHAFMRSSNALKEPPQNIYVSLLYTTELNMLEQHWEIGISEDSEPHRGHYRAGEIRGKERMF